MSDIENIYRNGITREIPLLGKWEFPPIIGTDDEPTQLIGFNYCLTAKKSDYEKTVHFYLDDYQFERIWNKPEVYIKILSKFRSCLTPDFSLYRNMPLAMQIYNVFRSRCIGYLMEQANMKVVITLQYSDPSSYEFCFDSLPQHKVYSASTVGVERDETARMLWKMGMIEALKRLKPKSLIIYGNDIGFDFKDVPVTYIKPYEDCFKKAG